MLSHFQAVEREEVEAVLFWATFYIVRAKVPINDPHLQDAVAIMAASAIPRGFHAYDLHTKEGVELGDAILTSMGTNKDGAAKTWNQVLQAGRNGLTVFKKEMYEKAPPTEQKTPEVPPAK